MSSEEKVKPKVLLVEDDMIIATDISMLLEEQGYDIVGICTRAEHALETIESNAIDIVLMDINLKGQMNGIEASAIILKNQGPPVIFLTSNTDDATFQQAIETKPYAFISKPFNQADLARTVAVTWRRMQLEKGEEKEQAERKEVLPAEDHISIMDDRLFIRHKNELVKVFLKDILYAEADRSYCHLITENQKYFLSTTLLKIESQLPDDLFVRIHRSFVVNLKKIDSIGEAHTYLTIDGKQLPISRRMKDSVLKHLKLI